MNKNAIAKTLLTIRPGLDDYANMLAERAHTHALCSCNTPYFTQHIIDKIIDLNVKQQTIHCLAKQLNQVLTKLPDNVQAVIHSYYRPYGNTPNIPHQCQQLGLAERTFYRHLARATTFIANHLNQVGINFFTWQDLLHQHAWIRETFMHQCQVSPLQTNAHQTEPNHSAVHLRQRTKQAS